MGVYLELFHGRRFIGEDETGTLQWESLNGWGTDGPIFGPFDQIQCTYGAQINLDGEADLDIVEGLVVYDRIGYGDWSVGDALGVESRGDFRERRSVFDSRKANADFLTQGHVLILAEDGEDCVVYLSVESAGEIWTADIDLATAFTLETALALVDRLAEELSERESIHVGRLQFVPIGDRIVRSETPQRVKSFCPLRSRGRG